jgi:CubicO group peptidase (beta-lactamase class C family)
MRLPRRHFLQMAAGAAVVPVLRARPALAQRAPVPPFASPPSPAERDAMAKLAQALMQKYEVPAFSFAVGYAGAVVHQEALGLADRESNEAVTPMHLFRIASMSKPITSVAVFTLIEQGRVKLSDKVFGPGAITGTDYAAPPYNAGVDQITVEQLLTHTGGGWGNNAQDPMFSNPTMNQAQLIAWTLKNRPLDNPPGQNYAYSNFGYCVLGRVIEKVTGQSYADYVRARVLNRSGITAMTIGDSTLAQRLPGEVKYYGSSPTDNPYSLNPARMDAHGGWVARPADYVQFVMHVDGFSRPPNILGPQTVQTMTTPSSANAGYAKGWSVNKGDNWWHNGSMNGTSTIGVRTHNGFCWAAFINIRRQNSPLDGDLDKLNWSMVQQVKSWQV